MAPIEPRWGFSHCILLLGYITALEMPTASGSKLKALVCPKGSQVFSSSSDIKKSACNAGDPGSIPELGRSLEKGMATLSSDAFELWWCWRRLLRVPWTARRSNQSILKAISPEYSLEGLMLKLKLQYFGHLM